VSLMENHLLMGNKRHSAAFAAHTSVLKLYLYLAIDGHMAGYMRSRAARASRWREEADAEEAPEREKSSVPRFRSSPDARGRQRDGSTTLLRLQRWTAHNFARWRFFSVTSRSLFVCSRLYYARYLRRTESRANAMHSRFSPCFLSHTPGIVSPYLVAIIV
jgi:hypothetical protein